MRSAALNASALVALLALLTPASVHAGSHLWRVSEFYSSPDHSIQFIEMREINGSNNETNLDSKWFKPDGWNQAESQLLGSDLPPGTAHKKFLVGTQSYAALAGVPAPDYVVPDGILDPSGDTVHWWSYQTIDIPPGVMPTNGVDSITVVDPAIPTYSVGTNSPTNFAGETGTVQPLVPDVPAFPYGGWRAGSVPVALLAGGLLYARRARSRR